VYNIIKQHQGNISVTSEPGKGTIFTITLPLLDLKGKTGLYIKSLELEPAKKTVFVIDHEQIIIDSTCRILNECGYNTVFAKSSAEALIIFKDLKEKIDLTLLEIMMPRINSLELIKTFLKEKPDALIAVCSLFHQDEHVKKALEYGAQFFIQKPFTVESLSCAAASKLGKNSC
jgi:CheY-like chemotaxis protein